MIANVKHAMFCMARQCWEQGVAAQAMLESGDTAALILMARDCVVRQNADGRLCDVEGTPALVDPAVCVEAVLEAGSLTGDAAMKAAAQHNIDYLLKDAPRTDDGARYHIMGECEVWADSLAMGPHVLMLRDLFDEGLSYYRAVRKRLLDSKTGLFFHKWDETAGRLSRPLLWGVGNGWAIVGLMRMAKELKRAEHPGLEEIVRDFHALANAMRAVQLQNGLFHDIMNDAESFTETETTEMFAYALYCMKHMGLLRDDSLLEAADSARAAVKMRIDARGILHGASGSPTFDKEGTSVEAQAHFIMMENAAAEIGR